MWFYFPKSTSEKYAAKALISSEMISDIWIFYSEKTALTCWLWKKISVKSLLSNLKALNKSLTIEIICLVIL